MVASLVRVPVAATTAQAPDRRRRTAVLLAGASAAALALGACGASKASGPVGAATGRTAAPARAQPIEVVASAYPLAQLVSYVGGADVRVVDLAGPGTRPAGLPMDAERARLVRSAQLVVDVGDGYQPQVEQAALHTRHHLALLPAVSPHQARPYEFWLSPTLMSAAAAEVATVLSTLDPTGARLFDNGRRDFQSVASSVSSDLESTFSTCSHQVFVTQDDAFGRMASAFGLTEVAVERTGVASAVATVRRQSLGAVFSDGAGPSRQLLQVARQAHVRVVPLDPLEVAPGPVAPGLSWFAVMEEDLTNLEGPLACNTSGSFA